MISGVIKPSDMWHEMGLSLSLFVQTLGSQQLGHHIWPQQRATLERYVFWC